MVHACKEFFITHKRFVRFIISGSTVAVIGILILFILVDLLKIWYLLSSTIAFFVTLVVNFILQKFWTFEDNAGKMHMQMSLFFLNALMNLVLNTVLMYGMVDMLRVHHLLAQGVVMGVLAVVNYTVYRVYIFRIPVEQSTKTL